MLQAAITSETPLALISERYITRLVNRGRKPQTIANARHALIAFAAWLDEQGIAGEDVTEDHIEAYFAPSRFPHSQGTRRVHAMQVKAAYRYAHRRGWVKTDPFVEFEARRQVLV
jgi:site-specific recombinase XerD